MQVTTVEVEGFKLRTLELEGELHYVLSDITNAIGYRLQPKETKEVRLPDATGRITRLVAISENELLARLLRTNKASGQRLLDQIALPEFPQWEVERSLLWEDKYGVVRLGHMPYNEDCRCPECLEQIKQK